VNKICTICILFLIVGCIRNIKENSGVIIIDIEPKVKNSQKIYLSDFAENIEYVPLYSEEDIILKGVYQMNKFKDLFFISDLTNCLLYNIDGKFVTKIGNQGDGPEEYRYVSRIAVSSTGKIYIQSLYDLLEYDINGKFLRKYNQIKKNGLWSIQSWISINDSLFFGQIPNFSGNEEFKAFIYDINGNIIYKFKNYGKFHSKRIETNNFANQANIYSFQNLIHFKERVNDTLFCLDDNFNLEPLFVFNLGSLSIPYIDFFQSKTTDNQFGYINNIFETDNYIFIDIISNITQLKRSKPVVEDGIKKWYFTNKLLGIYRKEDAKLEFSSITQTEDRLLRTGLYNDIDGGPKFYPEFLVDQSTLIMPIEAIKLKEYVASETFKTCIPKYSEGKKHLEKLANSLKETDNPVLMIVRLKE